MRSSELYKVFDDRSCLVTHLIVGFKLVVDRWKVVAIPLAVSGPVS